MTKTVTQRNLDDLREALETEQHARCELEDRLRRSRAEFQEFASRISHDLREPLRTVSIYSQLVSTKNPGDEDTGLYLKYIQDAIERSQVLLTAMMEYAAVDAEPRRPVAVDMNAIVQDALRRIPLASQNAITCDNLPSVVGEFDPLTRVVRHLLENALKFAQRPDPSIHVSARRAGADWTISVRDNGPGIDSSQHQRVFELFRRLHGREFPGIGLGLAYAKSVIESLGGKIWVESTPGEGATFLFSLPAVD